MNRLSMKQMELLVFVQTNLQVIENLGDRMHLKQLNHGKLLTLPKFQTMPSQAEEEENHYDF